MRLPATKKKIFSGVLVENRSDIKHIHGKKQNVEVGAFYKEKDSFVKVYLKFQVIFLVILVWKRLRRIKTLWKITRNVTGVSDINKKARELTKGKEVMRLYWINFWS